MTNSGRLPARVEHFALADPKKIFITYYSSNKAPAHLTFFALWKNANAAAAKLDRLGAKKGDLIELVLDTGPKMPEMFLGCLIIGSIPSFLAPPSPKIEAARYLSMISAMVKRSKPKFIIMAEKLRSRLSSALNDDDLASRFLVLEELESIEGTQFQSDVKLESDDPAFLQHSSGTTGLQKGVIISNRSLENQLQSLSECILLNSEDKIVSWLPLYHDMGLIACFLFPMYFGVHVVQIPTFDWLQRPDLFLSAVSKWKATLAWLPNFSYKFMAEKAQHPGSESWQLDSLRLLVNCSEPISDSAHEAFLRRFSEYGFREEALSSSYAMAENVFAVTQSEPGRKPMKLIISKSGFQRGKVILDSSSSLSLVSSGRVVRGTLIRILASQNDNESERTIGEILVAGGSLFSGYFHNKEATDLALSEGWYSSGDLGFTFNDELYVTGRKSDLIICSGKNIYPQDIEEIANECAGVHPGRLVAFGLFDKALGTDRVILLLERASSSEMSNDVIKKQIRTAVVRTLDLYLDEIVIVPSLWLLKSTSGKLSRSLNREKAVAMNVLNENGHQS